MSQIVQPPAAPAAPAPIPARRRINIGGVLVDDCPLEEAVARCAAWLRGGAPGVRQVVTVNPEFVMAARRDAEFRAVINGSDLAAPDGAGIIGAARLLGRPMRGRTTGVALVDRLAALAAAEGYRLFLLGAAPGVAEEAAGVLQGRHAGLQIAGTYPGSPAPAEQAAIAERITAAGADILLVAFGAPRQDLWIARNAARLPTVRLALGVGGVYDYLSGRVPLAPPLWRQAGLEWLYRLIRQPWRWRRQLALPRFVLLVLVQRLRGIRNA
jgi:N-acetylglucosaminyldiphosphoundecaprenol N-acetyl-beta-D-mannosaminyltransferase